MYPTSYVTVQIPAPQGLPVAIVVLMRPEGPTDDHVDALVVTDGDRQAVATLMAPGWRPSYAQITQAYGICFTDDG